MRMSGNAGIEHRVTVDESREIGATHRIADRRRKPGSRKAVRQVGADGRPLCDHNSMVLDSRHLLVRLNLPVVLGNTTFGPDVDMNKFIIESQFLQKPQHAGRARPGRMIELQHLLSPSRLRSLYHRPPDSLLSGASSLKEI